MPYQNIPGPKGSYIDGNLIRPRGTNQPRILVVGPAESGENEIFVVSGTSAAEAEFGSSSAVMRGVHEALKQGSNNVAVLRAGGRPGSFTLTDGAGGTLTIIPSNRDDKVLERYALFLLAGTSGSGNRVLVFDLTDRFWVYDSEELLAINDGLVDVEDDGLATFTHNDLTLPLTATSLADAVSGDFTATGLVIPISVAKVNGTDGTAPSNVERYAALESAYHALDYRDADLVVPVDAYADADNVVEQDAVTGDFADYGAFWAGVPQALAGNDILGYAWRYLYRGEMYTYFTDSPTYLADLSGAAPADATVLVDLVLTAAKDGKGGNGISIECVDAGGAYGSTTADVTLNGQTLDILVRFQTGSADTTGATGVVINSALAAFTLPSGAAASTLVAASTAGAGTIGVLAKTNLTGGVGGAVLSPADLQGLTIPAAVAAKFTAATDVQLREVNFAHQLASFLELASVNWKDMIGTISLRAPDRFSRRSLSNWAGDLPVYTDDGQDLYINSSADNGNGVLGYRFMAGESFASGTGYRNLVLKNATGARGLAYGGFIKTGGSALPNGSDWPYGIADGDEISDANGAPVDLGKHILISYEWPVLTNGYAGGSTYRGDFAASLAGRIAITPISEEPIGRNGLVQGVNSPLNLHSSQIDSLGQIRLVGLRQEENFGLILVQAKTAAHPSSDYTRLSTIRSVNKHLEDLRNIAKRYIGKAFSQQHLISLQSEIDLYCKEARVQGWNQGAKAAVDYTRTEKVVFGRLNIRLKIVPPFSIEQIVVQTSVAADESEL